MSRTISCPSFLSFQKKWTWEEQFTLNLGAATQQGAQEEGDLAGIPALCPPRDVFAVRVMLWQG